MRSALQLPYFAPTESASQQQYVLIFFSLQELMFNDYKQRSYDWQVE